MAFTTGLMKIVCWTLTNFFKTLKTAIHLGRMLRLIYSITKNCSTVSPEQVCSGGRDFDSTN